MSGPQVNRIKTPAYEAYPELDPRRPRVGRLIASALTAAVIAGGGAAMAAFVEAGAGGAVSTNALWAALLVALGAAAKDYRTYLAPPPVHGAGKRR